MSREDLHFRLRIPQELKEKIEKAAADSRRSQTAEIVARLEQSFEAPDLDPAVESDIMNRLKREESKLDMLLHHARLDHEIRALELQIDQTESEAERKRLVAERGQLIGERWFEPPEDSK